MFTYNKITSFYIWFSQHVQASITWYVESRDWIAAFSAPEFMAILCWILSIEFDNAIMGWRVMLYVFYVQTCNYISILTKIWNVCISSLHKNMQIMNRSILHIIHTDNCQNKEKTIIVFIDLQDSLFSWSSAGSN